jgi:hypothetical protein
MSFIFVDVAGKVNISFGVFVVAIVLIALSEVPLTW